MGRNIRESFVRPEVEELIRLRWSLRILRGVDETEAAHLITDGLEMREKLVTHFGR